MSRLWMVAYDISHHASRRQVYQLLLNHGERVQYSVFECRLNADQLVALREAVANHLAEDDSARWYPLCAWCESAIDRQGCGNPVDDSEFYLL